MRNSSRYFLCLIVFGAGLTLSDAQAQQVHRWITGELANGSYTLSDYEENGLYCCSSAEQKIVDTKFENGYALIIFEHAALAFSCKKRSHRICLKNCKPLSLTNFTTYFVFIHFFVTIGKTATKRTTP
jgi:hypothetical protein